MTEREYFVIRPQRSLLDEHPQLRTMTKGLSEALVRQAKLDASSRVKVPVR